MKRSPKPSPASFDPFAVVLAALNRHRARYLVIAGRAGAIMLLWIGGGSMKPRINGHYVVADPEICHGQPTFRGTRILVSDILDQVARGESWDEISRSWRGRVTKEAIAEAVRLANRALVKLAS